VVVLDVPGDAALTVPDHLPRFPSSYRPGVGIIGCGSIVSEAHIPVYHRYNVPIIGIFDKSVDAAKATARKFGVPRIFDSVEELIYDSAVEVVDIATHPDVRPKLIFQALNANKHVLAQKPFAKDMESALRVAHRTLNSESKVAINQNGRWAPPWYVATRLIKSGVIGEIVSATFLQNTNFAYVPGTVYDNDKHFGILDFSVHWIDIIRCWMENVSIESIRARQYRLANQPLESRTAWGQWIEIAYQNGVSALIRGAGFAQPKTQGHPFWVHGSLGTLRGSVRHREFLELELNDVSYRFNLKGEWYLDGFAGALGELLLAIEEDREPYNSARHNLLTLQMTLAACVSADGNCVPVELGPLSGDLLWKRKIITNPFE